MQHRRRLNNCAPEFHHTPHTSHDYDKAGNDKPKDACARSLSPSLSPSIAPVSRTHHFRYGGSIRNDIFYILSTAKFAVYYCAKWIIEDNNEYNFYNVFISMFYVIKSCNHKWFTNKFIIIEQPKMFLNHGNKIIMFYNPWERNIALLNALLLEFC